MMIKTNCWYCSKEYEMGATIHTCTEPFINKNHKYGHCPCDGCKEYTERKDVFISKWIPCSERLPEDIRPVIVTWKNTDPASYYQYIVGKHFIGTAHYHRGKWYWYSSVTEDLLAEYGKCDSEEFDEAIEAVAWMPLPEPLKGADDE